MDEANKAMNVAAFLSKKGDRLLFKNRITPWLFVLPGVFFTILLRYIPIFVTVYYSLFDYDISKPPGKFVGLSNYMNIIMRDSFYIKAWENTLTFLILVLILTFVPTLIQAICLSEVNRGRNLLSAIYILPAMIPGTIYIILWKWIWDPKFGLANSIIGNLGIHAQTWLSDPAWTKFCIIFPGIIGGGFGVLYYLAAIMGVSQEIYEAALIDGCKGLKKIFYITLPNISFLIKINLVLSVISVMQMFDAPYQYTKGGPAGAAYTMGIYIYNQFYEKIKLGESSAAAVLLFIVVAVMTIVQRRLNKQNA